MLPDQRHFFKDVLSIIREENINAVCIAGDVYDKTIPTEEAVQLFDDFLVELSRLTDVFIISGNHDSEERLNYGSRLFKANNVYIVAKFNGKLTKHEKTDDYGKVNFYLLPFIKASQVKHFYPDRKINSYNDAVATVLESAQMDISERNVIIAHQFVIGKGDAVPTLSGSENASVANVGTVESIKASLFAPFDYAALGHIHSPQAMGVDYIRYAGSPISYSLNEIGTVKSVPIITLEEKGNVSIELREIHPLHEMRKITGTMEQILQHGEETEDYVYVTLTDEIPVMNAMAKLRELYPNIMKLDYDNTHTKALGNVEPEKVVTRSLNEILSDFYKEMFDSEITEEELYILNSVAKEAGL